MTQPLLHPDLQHAYSAMQTVQARLQQVIRGRDAVIAQVVIALFADGHVLLEDYPGSGKTTLAKALGDALDQGEGVHDAAILPFRRIQFTPDLLPSDITGTTIFDVESRQFAFHRGPLFAHIVLADEINRTSPKVQAAMLEAMAEKQVTVDTVSYPLDELFFVIATQNPMDLNGTYPLPKPQLDRFLFKICMTPIAPAAELEVLAQYPQSILSLAQRLPQISRDTLLQARQSIRSQVYIAPAIKESLVNFSHSLRQDARIAQGNSTRSLILMLAALQTHALLQGRDFVSPADIEALVPVVLGHRIVTEAQIQEPMALIRECIAPHIDALAKHTLQRENAAHHAYA